MSEVGSALQVGALAQSRPVELLVAFAPGGLTDVVARIVGEVMARELAQPVVVKNVVGAGGNIAFSQLARARSDGHTLGLLSLSAVTNSLLRPGGGYDPLTSFTPIGYIGTQPFVLLVNPTRFDAATVGQTIERLQANPGHFSYSSGGVGAPSHVLMEYFNATHRLNVLHVPYNGQSAAVTAVLSGEVDMTLQTITGAEELVRTGKLRALAVSGPRRIRILPNVPTFAEVGVDGLDGSGWMGIVAPAGLAPAAESRFDDAWRRMTANVELQQTLEARAVEVTFRNGAEFGHFMREDRRFWASAIATAKVRLD
ncbi:TPA: tripartite tricarboxylate transporter substrate binding protein [Pseudomonas aeruginosa]|nr:tripartite tricarboxylate transporter substrate binding protein [Pseudomonas aeruginosa]HEJ6151362.1 tripartite tricarboxylate transporter substrate binding protein [Pseudomonas aeruginosa]